MSLKTVTHLNFRGEARAALDFYQSVFGGEKMMVSYQDAENVQDPSEADHVMWGQVAADSGFRVMAYDVPSRMPWNSGENAFFVSIRSNSAEELTACWEKLSEGATVLQPLGPAGWSVLYGMLKDQFGIIWVMDVESEYSAS